MKIRSVKIFVILLSAVFFNFSSCDKGVDPNILNYHNRILFTSKQSGKPQLYMMNPDGSDIIQITSGQYGHWSGVWSWDATKIVCNTNEGLTSAGEPIVVMNVDGTGRTLLNVFGGPMGWSPDGKKIAFTSCPTCEGGELSSYIFLINPDGTGLEQLTKKVIDRQWDSNPNWSPDGKYIAYVSNINTQLGDIYTIEVQTGAIKRITFADSAGYGSPRWSPNGTKFAFNYSGNAMIMNANGNEIKSLTSISGSYIGPKAWSPNGTQLALTSISLDGMSRDSVYTINVDGTGLKKLSVNISHILVDWSK